MADETFQLQIARPDHGDLDAATDLMVILDDLSKGYYPTEPKAQGVESPTWFDEDDYEHLAHLYTLLRGIMERAPGFQGRVMLGMSVVCSPSNNIIDPTSDVLELSPHLKACQQDHHRIARMLELNGMSIEAWRQQVDTNLAASATSAEGVPA